jgi:DNA polymerase
VFLLDDWVYVWIPPGRLPAERAKAFGELDPDQCWPAGFPQRTLSVEVSELPPRPIREAIRAGYTFVAHNAGGFDREAWSRFVPGLQPSWYDTLPCSRAAGLPGGLDALGKVLVGRGKDAGSKALALLYTARQTGAGVAYNVGTFPLWHSVLRYNVADVLLLERVYEETHDYGEADVLTVHSTINDRGCPVDIRYARNIWELWHQNEEYARGEVARLTGGDISEEQVSSVPHVKRWLAAQGFDCPTLNRQALQEFYDTPDEDLPEQYALAVEVLRLRQSATRATKGKVSRVFDVVDDDSRVRNMFRYYGAHTGRWSAGGLQPHNMAKGSGKLDTESLLTKDSLSLLDVARAAVDAGCSLDDAMVTLFRPIVRAKPGNSLVIADYGQVEARGVAWIFREQGALATFSDPTADPYCEMASKIYGREISPKDKAERAVGKETVLGCGYSMGAPKFAARCKLMRIDLAAAGTTAEACVKAYRAAHPAIVRGWRDIGKAAMRAVETREYSIAGRCNFLVAGKTLTVTLPSGRELQYRNARIEQRVPGYCALLGIPAELKPTIVYDHPHGYAGVLYGGLLTENIVQGLCRDLLADAMVRNDDPCNVVLHVHDEIVCEQDDRDAADVLRRLCLSMSAGPKWAAGFPILVEGFTNRVYSKSPFTTSHKCKALGGSYVN